MSSKSRDATAPLRDLALHIGKSSLSVADECLRFRYEEAPDLLALMASRGEMDYAGVLATVHDVLEGRIAPPESRAALDPYALSSLARLMAGLRTPAQDFREVADLSRAVRMIRGSVPLPRGAARIEGQANLAVGRYDDVQRMLDEDDLDSDTRWMLRAELEHPAHGKPGASEEAWLKAFNQRFVDQGLLPVRLVNGPGDAFDRLAVDVPPEMMVDDPAAPLVTVVMSTFRPDQNFPTAVASIVNQTWRNLEILVVDDDSPPEFDDLLESVVAMDARIRLLRMPENGGTYKIRNHAIAQSSGEFITFQDSDDWAHPERIARQVAPLLEPTGLMATHARSLRVHHDLTTLKVGYNSFRRGAASLMLRRELLSSFGGFDETRKAADTEFEARLTAALGEEANVNLPEVLVMTHLTEGSLSREEFQFGWHHGARFAFRQAWRHWHRRIAEGLETPMLEPGAPRRYPAPTRFVTGRDAPPTECDVMWVSDWRGGTSRYTGIGSLVEAVARSGRSTMIAHTSAVRHSERERYLPFADDIMQLQRDGLTRLAIWTERTHSRVLLVSDPELLALTRPPETVGLTTDRLVIVAGHPPAAPTGNWSTYDPATVERNAKRMFGVEPAWLPAHAGIADDLRLSGGTAEILPPGQLRAAPTVRPRRYASPRGGSRLIVGTTALELSRRDRPSWASLRRRLPRDDAYDVRVRAEPEVLRTVMEHRRVPPGWLVMDESTPMRAFLRQLDVFVAVPPRSWGPELAWSVIAALAEGAVVVTDPAYEQHLRGAAVFTRAVDVHDELKALAADPERLVEYRERGYAFCRDVLSADVAVRLVDELGGFETGDR